MSKQHAYKIEYEERVSLVWGFEDRLVGIEVDGVSRRLPPEALALAERL